jgi:hypothetical protein
MAAAGFVGGPLGRNRLPFHTVMEWVVWSFLFYVIFDPLIITGILWLAP